METNSMRIVFRNLDKSTLVKETVEERIGEVFEKFPKLREHRITVTLSMENSPIQAGPDFFSVRVLIQGPDFKQIKLEKNSQNLYVALADVKEHLLEQLNRFGDKNRVRQRSRARKWRSLMAVGMNGSDLQWSDDGPQAAYPFSVRRRLLKGEA